MTYGTERFLAGGGEAPTVKIFDYRWPKTYYHTSGISCFDRAPFPRPHQPFLKPPTRQTHGRAACDHTSGKLCHWHALSRRIYYRPNAKYFLSGSLRSFRSSSVWSLARPSDLSPNLYIGISGGVIEAHLEQCPDKFPSYPYPFIGDIHNTSANIHLHDPNFGFPDWRAAAPPESGYKSRALVPSLMEIGDGYSFPGNDRSILLGSLLTYHGPTGEEGLDEEAGEEKERKGEMRRHHRLDLGYHQVMDYEKESRLAERYGQLVLTGAREDDGM